MTQLEGTNDRLNLAEIKRLLPHRPPALLIDSVENLHVGSSGTGIVLLSEHPHITAGHFPDEPVIPGFVILECLAQTAAAVFADSSIHTPPTSQDKISRYLASIEKARFYKPVGPKDTLMCHVELQKIWGNLIKINCIASVDSSTVTKASLVLHQSAS